MQVVDDPAGVVVERLAQAARAGDHIVLTGGSTPKRAYELAAQLQAAAFDYLEAPIQRVGAPYTPVPVSPPLEDAYRPTAADIVHAARVAFEWGQYDVEPWDKGALAPS